MALVCDSVFCCRHALNRWSKPHQWTTHGRVFSDNCQAFQLLSIRIRIRDCHAAESGRPVIVALLADAVLLHNSVSVRPASASVRMPRIRSPENCFVMLFPETQASTSKDMILSTPSDNASLPPFTMAAGEEGGS